MDELNQANSHSYLLQDSQYHLATTPKNHSINKNKKNKKRQAQLFTKRVKRLHYNNSLWTLQENRAYMIFLESNFALFSLGNIQKRDIKINVLMSKCVQTRSPDQCRSHHQKMIKYHKNIPSIIEYITNLKASKKQNPSTCESKDETEYQLKDLMQIEWPLVQESFCQLLMNYK